MKHKVFVSSTINDLLNERVAAERAITAAQCEPRMSDKTVTANSAVRPSAQGNLTGPQ